VKKIAFYCQNVLGVGHITRSRSIVKELAESCDVTFILGGEDAGIHFSIPRVKKILLPPIMMKEVDGTLYVPGNSVPLEHQWHLREVALSKISEHFDALIIELFPFGRKKFGNEILSFQQKLKKINPRLLTFCSLRDIMIKKLSEEKRAAKIIHILTANFDKVLVHSDPRIIPLDLTWPAAKDVKELISYTGFVAETQKNTKHKRINNKILVSSGGGNVGSELFEKIAQVAHFFPEHTFQFILGPYMPKEKKDLIRDLVKKTNNIEFADFLPDFEQHLKECALSISLAGYNTVMNILNTKTPALLYPYQANWEQLTRLDILADKGCLLKLESLDDLEASIREALNFSPKEFAVDLSGARGTRKIVDAPVKEIK
jgi:predicted glycosyltransferase